VCQGQTSKQIALDLGLSHRTVEVFRARILKKTGAANAAALAALLKLNG
ncbi:MAG: helix-turn-helix transcriptional regulator, partial [Brevundimonas sp.]|nr:helix-turn-helix transcriptional regulator [Brevundimonas sp.]